MTAGARDGADGYCREFARISSSGRRRRLLKKKYAVIESVSDTSVNKRQIFAEALKEFFLKLIGQVFPIYYWS